MSLGKDASRPSILDCDISTNCRDNMAIHIDFEISNRMQMEGLKSRHQILLYHLLTFSALGTYRRS